MCSEYMFPTAKTFSLILHKATAPEDLRSPIVCNLVESSVHSSSDDTFALIKTLLCSEFSPRGEKCTEIIYFMVIL